MPTELRDIIFTPLEARDALSAYAQAQKWDLQGAPIDLEVNEGTEVSARLVTERGAMTFTAPEITAALLLYAGNHGIPVPRRAQKELRVYKSQLHLRLRLS